jgi:regulatory protein
MIFGTKSKPPKRKPKKLSMISMSDQSPQFKHLLGLAFRFLALRPRSQTEVQTRLSKYSPDDHQLVEKVMAYLVAENLINDAEFLSWWVRVRGDKRSHSVLTYELLHKGLSRTFILEHFPKNAKSDQTVLNTLLLKKTHGVIPTDPFARHKLFRYLLSKGFSSEAISVVLKECNI